MSLTIGSLFSGIGGLELGLERGIGNGARTVFQVEQSEYCRAVLAKHWPDAERFDDVRTVGAHNLSLVDVLCGGFPCQDVSGAGRRAGVIVGTRSGLWFEYSRIIRELRPRYVVVENVAALLTLGLDAVLGELAASGYDAEWQVLSAGDAGADHLRERVFVLAYPAGVGRPQVVSRPSRLGHAPRHGWASGNAHSCASAAERLSRLERVCGEPAILGGGDGLPNRVDRLRAIGNAVAPDVAEVVGRLIAQREAERQEAA